MPNLPPGDPPPPPLPLILTELPLGAPPPPAPPLPVTVAPFAIQHALYAAFDGTLEARVAAFRLALEEHRFTVDVPRPIEDGLVERIVAAGGMENVTILPPPEQPPAPPPSREITSLAFRRLFTRDEINAITLAAAQALAAGDATLRSWMDDLQAAGSLDLDDPLLAEALDYLVATNLLTPARRNAILE